MKLCRFELANRPGEMRSGIMFDQRIYETDGEKAIGIHELIDIKFLSPLGTIPSVRLFDMDKSLDPEGQLAYSYAHPSQVFSPLAEVEMPPGLEGLDVEIRVAGVVQDSGTQIDIEEAPGFILGYSIMINLLVPELKASCPGAAWRDMGAWFGTLIVTPDDLSDVMLRGEPTRFESPYRVVVNKAVIFEGIWRPDVSFAELLYAGTRVGSVAAGEVIAWPALPVGSLAHSKHGELLLPSDKIQVDFDALGTLVGRIV